MTLRVALVGGPMYDHLYELFAPGEVDVVVHADHPTLNRRVAALLAAGERIDVLATHAKYAPSQAAWLRPLDELVDATAVAALAPRAVELCRFDGTLLCVPRLIDVRVLWARTDRVEKVPDSWAALVDSDVVYGFPGRESGLFGTFFELVVGLGGQLFDDDLRPTMATPEARHAVETLCTLAARAPRDLVDWHYDGVDAALLDGRVDAAAAWPGGFGAIRAVRGGRAPATTPLPRRSGASRLVLGLPRLGDPAHVRRSRRHGRVADAADRRRGTGQGRGRRQHLRTPARARGRRAAGRARPPSSRHQPRDDRRRDDQLSTARALPGDRRRGMDGDP